MVEVGQLEVAGTMNTENIDSGFKRIKNDMKEMENQSNQTNVALGKMAGIGKTLGKVLITAGVAGATALTALGTKSPAAAGVMAKIDVSLLKLSNTVGRALMPAFEGFNNLIGNFNSFLSGGAGGSPDGIFKGAIAGGGIGAIAGGILGFMVAGPAGIIPGATLGATIGTVGGAIAGKDISEAYNKNVQPVVEDYSDYKEIGENAGYSESKSKAFGFAAAYMKWISDFLNKTDDKDATLAMPTGNSRT